MTQLDLVGNSSLRSWFGPRNVAAEERATQRPRKREIVDFKQSIKERKVCGKKMQVLNGQKKEYESKRIINKKINSGQLFNMLFMSLHE